MSGLQFNIATVLKISDEDTDFSTFIKRKHNVCPKMLTRNKYSVKKKIRTKKPQGMDFISLPSALEHRELK